MSRVIPFPALAAAPDAGCPAPLSVSLHDAVAAFRRRYRTVIAAAGEWALANGISLPADHIALWAAVAEELGYADDNDADGATGPWRASHIPEFLDTVEAWCTLAGCSPPPTLVESLWHLYGFLAATGRLHPNSDPLRELRAAVVVFAGFDRFRPFSAPPPEPTAA